MSYNEAGEQALLNKGMGLYFFHLPTGREVLFKAFLTAYEDSFQSKWSSERVYGRNDPIHTFQGTERSISLAWDVPAASYKEGKENFINASTLYAMLYPAYKPRMDVKGEKIGIISGAPLVKIKFGNLIIDASATRDGSNGYAHQTAKDAGLLGYLDGLKFSPDLDSGFFDGGEPNRPQNQSTAPGELIPQTIKLSCNFHVLHSHPLGWQAKDKSLRKDGSQFPYNANIPDAPGPRGSAAKPVSQDVTNPAPTSSELTDEDVARMDEVLAGQSIDR